MANGEELAVLIAVDEMCTESLSPELSEKWEQVRTRLILNRKNLKIDWEFVNWAEKSVHEANIKGADDLGHDYLAIGIMGSGEIQEVKDVELVNS